MEAFMLCEPGRGRGSNVFELDGGRYVSNVISQSLADLAPALRKGKKIAKVDATDPKAPLFISWVDQEEIKSARSV